MSEFKWARSYQAENRLNKFESLWLIIHLGIVSFAKTLIRGNEETNDQSNVERFGVYQTNKSATKFRLFWMIIYCFPFIINTKRGATIGPTWERIIVEPPKKLIKHHLNYFIAAIERSSCVWRQGREKEIIAFTTVLFPEKEFMAF